MAPEPRDELLGLPPAVHGGGAGGDAIDFSTGVSPLPTPPSILEAARAADLTRYPHPTALPLRAAVAEAHATPPDQVVAGAGSTELIWAVARAFGGAGRTGLVVVPAFGEYEQALRASGARVVTVGMHPPAWDLSIPDLERALGAQHVALVFVCRPSNPCLTSAPASALAELARAWPRTLFVFDEAYQPMFEDVAGTRVEENVAVLRSLTKLFALPGLRLGYLLASRQVAAAIQAALPPWNVSSAAQAAGVVAVTLAPSEAPMIRARLGALRRHLERTLSGAAGAPERAGGPFLLYRVPTAAHVARRLREQGFLVRACASFGLPDHLRLGLRREEEHAALAAAWRRVR